MGPAPAAGRPGGPPGAPLEALEEPQQQDVGGQLFHAPRCQRTALGAAQLGVAAGQLPQAGFAEGVLAWQDAGGHVQRLQAQGTLQQVEHG